MSIAYAAPSLAHKPRMGFHVNSIRRSPLSFINPVWGFMSIAYAAPSLVHKPRMGFHVNAIVIITPRNPDPVAKRPSGS